MAGQESLAASARYRVWYGRDEPPRDLRELRAGPLTVQLDGGDLRYVRLGEVEVARRIYAAVRDPNWNTVPGVLSDLRIHAGDGSFDVQFECRHRQGPIDYLWHGAISGSPDGVIVYEMSGQAAGEFRHNKIGLNIHHPMREAAGRPYTAATSGGDISGVLPDTIGPQLLVDGIDVPLFTPCSRLTIEQEGAHVSFDFEGAEAEMEDQRNWSDASFKTYMPPQMRGFPYLAQAGQRFHHKITIAVAGAGAPRQRAARPTVEIGRPAGPRLPRLGLGMASHGGDLTAREAELLRSLQLDHLRVDLTLADAAFAAELARATRAARALACGLELAVFLSDAAARELAALRGALAGVNVPIRRVLVFRAGEETAAGRWVQLARETLAQALPGAQFAGGTNAYFNELNRHRPEVAAMDAVTYSVNPQIHAFDELSLAEAVAAQAEQVRSARAFAGEVPIVVSPVTLRPRFNAVATDPSVVVTAGGLPWEVDPRQMSLFGSVWTLGSVKHLAESGVHAVTYYETVGWRGLLENAAGAPLPDLFPSQPGMVFPLYHIFADLAEWRDGVVMPSTVSTPLAVTVLAVRLSDTVHVLAGNFTARPQHVLIAPLPVGPATVRSLDETTAQQAAFEPAAFRAQHMTLQVDQGQLTLELAPYATVRIDAGGRQ